MVANIFQIIDNDVGERGKLKRALFNIVKITSTLPNSMVISDYQLKSRYPVNGGGCADIFKGTIGDRNDIVVAFKAPRIFSDSDMSAVFHVQFYYREALVHA